MTALLMRPDGTMPFQTWLILRDRERAESQLQAEMLTFPEPEDFGIGFTLRREPDRWMPRPSVMLVACFCLFASAWLS